MGFQVRALLVASFGAILIASAANATFLPPNDLGEQDGFIQQSAITEQQFNDTLALMQKTFAPIAQTLGGTLQVTGNWASTTVNAQATQVGNVWKVEIFGALARRPEVSIDSLEMVIGHEIGHHLAGFSFVEGKTLPFPIPFPIPGFGEQWAANEGQSDYFSTFVAARKLWASETAKNATFRDKLPEVVRVKCETVFKTANEQNLCLRTNHAGLELATLLGAMPKTPSIPKFETPDKSVVSKTNDEHPAAQCRLDTYFAGSLCTAKWNEAKIPGRKHRDGQESAAAEREASTVSCMKVSGFDQGIRPTCWFHPSL